MDNKKIEKTLKSFHFAKENTNANRLKSTKISTTWQKAIEIFCYYMKNQIYPPHYCYFSYSSRKWLPIPAAVVEPLTFTYFSFQLIEEAQLAEEVMILSFDIGVDRSTPPPYVYFIFFYFFAIYE
jgi:hypothetical protein